RMRAVAAGEGRRERGAAREGRGGPREPGRHSHGPRRRLHVRVELTMEEKLREAALAVSSAEGERFYENLVTAIASILDVEYVAIAVYTGPDQQRLKTIARFAAGRIVRNLEYPIAGTPCEKSMGHAFGFFPSGVCQRFPNDADLQALQTEGYAASTLTDAAGDAIGLVWVMSKRELTNRALTETVLKVFAARIGREIERQRAA